MSTILFEETVPDLAGLQRVAERIAAIIRIGDWIWLEGELGAGKTTLVRAILKAWGYDGPVTSPTYTLMNEYEHEGWGKKIIHLDGFRLLESKATELPWDARDWNDAILFAEWPEKTGLPAKRFKYRIVLMVQADGATRLIRLILDPFS